MIKIAYYPGCSLLGSSREYDESLRAIAGPMGFELVQVPDWNCCGASSAHSLNHELSLALRILALAETLGMEEMLVPCAACYSRLMTARHDLAENDLLRARINEIIGMEYKGTVKPLNILEFLECHADAFKDKVKAPFDKDVACYYGCLLVRPPKVVNFDRTEDPRTMDNLVEMIGAKALDWDFKVECCGAGHSISKTILVGKLSSKIIGNAVKKGAQTIVVAPAAATRRAPGRRRGARRGLPDVPLQPGHASEFHQQGRRTKVYHTGHIYHPGHRPGHGTQGKRAGTAASHRKSQVP